MCFLLSLPNCVAPPYPSIVQLDSFHLYCLGVLGLDHGSADWIATEIEVRIKETHDDPSLIHQIGVIRNTSVSTRDHYSVLNHDTWPVATVHTEITICLQLFDLL